MANEKDLKKLKAEDKKAVAGGNIYYSRENNAYYVPNPYPDPTSHAENYWKRGYGSVAQMQANERAAGRGANVYSYDTTEKAKAAAEAEAKRIANPPCPLWKATHMDEFLSHLQ